MPGQSLLDGFAFNRFEMNQTRRQFNAITPKKNIPAFFDHIRSATTWFAASENHTCFRHKYADLEHRVSVCAGDKTGLPCSFRSTS
jgi:hypothetical protein